MRTRISFDMRMGRRAFRRRVRIGGGMSNARVDALLTGGGGGTDQAERRRDYVEVQQILAEDLPGIPLWYPNNEVVHTLRITNVTPNVSGNFEFLRGIEVAGDSGR